MGHSMGVKLAVENRELHDIIMVLRDERDMKHMKVYELKQLLATIQDKEVEALMEQSVRLTELTTKLRRQLNAKQAFCEGIVAGNEALKEQLQSHEDERILDVRRMKAVMGDAAKTVPEVKEILSQVWDDGCNGDDNADGDNHEDDNKTLEGEETDKLMAEVEYAQPDSSRAWEELTVREHDTIADEQG